MPLATPKRLQGQTPSHARAKVQEKETAKRIGGRQTRASGAKDEKGDVRLKGFVRIENKTTVAASYGVSIETLRKLEEAVLGSGEIPILQVELKLGAKSFVVMPDWALELVMEAVTNAKPD
jgi:hypothetical protein